MSKYIALDAGHSVNTAGKRTPPIAELGGRVIRENEFNHEVVRLTNIELQRCGFKTLITAPDKNYDTPLITRTNLANKEKVDLLISFHFNALTGSFETSKAEGFSVHVDPTMGRSADFARILLKHLAGGTSQKNRGLVQQNLHMTRETKMPAVLVEFGFMDNKREAMLMIDKGFQKECAVETAKAVCEFYGVAYKPEATKAEVKPTPAPTHTPNHIGVATVTATHLNVRKGAGVNHAVDKVVNKGSAWKVYEIKSGWYRVGINQWISSSHSTYKALPKPTPAPVQPKGFYRVVVGSFKSSLEADKRIADLKVKKVESFKISFLNNNVLFFRVIAGSFKDKKNAEDAVSNLKKLGFEAFIAFYAG